MPKKSPLSSLEQRFIKQWRASATRCWNVCGFRMVWVHKPSSSPFDTKSQRLNKIKRYEEMDLVIFSKSFQNATGSESKETDRFPIADFENFWIFGVFVCFCFEKFSRRSAIKTKDMKSCFWLQIAERRLNLSRSQQPGHSATYNTPFHYLSRMQRIYPLKQWIVVISQSWS